MMSHNNYTAVQRETRGKRFSGLEYNGCCVAREMEEKLELGAPKQWSPCILVFCLADFVF